jgi:CII-binding regulator of phage lambda lysogenization HflD
MIPTVEHLRIQLDELEKRVGTTRTASERRNFLLDLVALERSLGAAGERVATEGQQLEVIRKRLRRLRAVG